MGEYLVRADSFKLGQRVELSAEADRAGVRPGKRSGRTGRVARLDPDWPFTVWVLQDGYAQAQGFAAEFWQPIPPRRRHKRG